jgi:hypothetical protein
MVSCGVASVGKLRAGAREQEASNDELRQGGVADGDGCARSDAVGESSGDRSKQQGKRKLDTAQLIGERREVEGTSVVDVSLLAINGGWMKQSGQWRRGRGRDFRAVVLHNGKRNGGQT